jgi:hypothetical protein
MKLTQKQKIDGYDRLADQNSKLDLAVYDMVNSKFGIAKTYTPKRIREELEYEYSGSAYTVSMSWRGNPLFLVRYLSGNSISPEIWTETEIQDNYRAHPTSIYWHIIMHARNELVSEQMQKERAA